MVVFLLLAVLLLLLFFFIVFFLFFLSFNIITICNYNYYITINIIICHYYYYTTINSTVTFLAGPFSVVYSDKFKIKGKPEHTNMVSVHMNAGELTKTVLPKAIPANISGKRRHTSHPSPWIERKGRGPLLFSYSRVSYDKRDGRLCLSDIVGKDIRARGPPEKQEAYETVVDKEQRELEGKYILQISDPAVPFYPPYLTKLIIT